jgi:hypothetical protein
MNAVWLAAGLITLGAAIVTLHDIFLVFFAGAVFAVSAARRDGDPVIAAAPADRSRADRRHRHHRRRSRRRAMGVGNIAGRTDGATPRDLACGDRSGGAGRAQ